MDLEVPERPLYQLGHTLFSSLAEASPISTQMIRPVKGRAFICLGGIRIGGTCHCETAEVNRFNEIDNDNSKDKRCNNKLHTASTQPHTVLGTAEMMSNSPSNHSS